MADGREIMRGFIPASPLVALLGIQIVSLGDDEATLSLPYRPELTTVGEVVHGGAIAALADTAVMAACWCYDDPPESLRGSTVDLTVHYLAPALASDLSAHARVLRRGRRICHVGAAVTDSGGTEVAHAVGTYQIG
ncbi:MAG TPA: PaaI family thioesterase [Mycobacteriales bacterium]|nr:PaaI family thioesterase [Mycobacteriales bacterium]